ncbi:MAG TPA: CehA/McbA family metallohydrolase, partial [Polyangiaceae bacterium]|nr:CehA/McbA family metallohydrolase [Polyangiaceae bacterium]
PGEYQLFVTSGIERDAAALRVRIAAGRTQPVEARLPRVVATPGFIAADLHLHQAPSVDADISLPARVVAVAAEGVEFAVATDHYVVTDLGPTVRELRDQGVLSADLTTVVGTEVSTLGHRFGHFNVFPLNTNQNVRFRDATVDELFADARKQVGSGIVQVNHPRLEPNLGYFTYFGIDDRTGRMSRPGFNAKFDTLEVYNGDDAFDFRLVRRVFTDWLHLLELGERWPATGSSDSHKLAFLDPGLPRTMIRHSRSGDDRTDVHAAVADVLAALKAGRSLVTSGPLVHASINGKMPGERAEKAGPRPRLRLRIEAAPWIDVGSLEIHIGGSGTPWRTVPIPRTARVIRYEAEVELAIGRSTFVIVAALGARPLPNASRATQPFAFTNPIWVEP